MHLDSTAGAGSPAFSRLSEVRRKLPLLVDRAAAALANGNEELARLALQRQRVLLAELENLATILDSEARAPRLLERVEAVDRLLEASLRELARLSTSEFRLPPSVHVDPAVEAQLAHMSRKDRD